MDPVCSVVGKILDLSVEPIWNNISYIFNHKKNIENLRGHLENLEARRNGMQGSIDAAIRNREEIRPDVKLWIEKVDLIKQKSIQFLGDDATNVNKKCFHGWFPDLITRYQVGKKAAKKILEIQQLQGEGKFENISFDAPPPGIQSMSDRNFVAYKTTEIAMMKVIEALKDTNIDLIGIHGMGGVGKTTLVKEIGKKAEEEKLFKEVVMAVVSQNIDLKKIQGQIADMLGLKFESESDTGRANKLRNRLKDATLIILDDVWARLNVEGIGIPFPFDEAHKNCKIVITTRREQVCHAMGTRRESTKIIRLDVLSEEESWDLFKRNAGDIVDFPTLNTVAKNVFQECRCLPLALVTVGRAMKSKDKPEEWIEAAQELKKSMPTNIEGVDEEVYKSLKLSYDYLKDEETKSCFLLCCLFPEDHIISIEDLVRYGIGLRIFKNVDTVQEARRRVITVIKNLQDSCLLLTSEPPFYLASNDLLAAESGFTKMHDIVRDVAISIAFDKYFVRAGVNLEEWPNMETLGSYNGISLMCNRICNGLPVARELLPNLQILLVQDNTDLVWSHSDELFSRLKALTVLDMSNTVATVQPHRLTNNCFGDMQYLRTLILNGIEFQAWDTDFLENLKSLEVLSVKRCWFVMPINIIEKLTNLRLLDLTEIRLHHIIPANVISQLSRLEELHMYGSIIDWIISSPIEIAGLQSLSRLKVLSMSLDATQIGPEDFTFPDWESFLINLGVGLFGPGPGPGPRPEVYNANFMSLENILVQAMMFWPKWVKRLFKRTNRLQLDGMKDLKNILPDLSFVGDNLNVLKELRLSLASEFEYLINTKEWSIPPIEHHQQVLSNLEELGLYQLHSFKGICHGSLPSISSGFLSKLECLYVYGCPKLSNVLLPFNLLQRLPGLRLLEIGYCESLEQVFDFEIEGLVDGHKGHEVQLLSSLRELNLFVLPRLKHLFNFHGRIVRLDNLLVLRVKRCHSLKNLFRHFVARNLQKLKELSVSNCKNLEEIVGKESAGQEEEEKVDKIVFASLQTLTLDSLSNLNGFCTGSSPFDWPSLENVEVRRCPKMITFATVSTICGIQSMPKLKAIRLDGVEKTLEGEDLNTVIEKHFKEKEVLEEEDLETDNEEEEDLE